VDLQGITHEQLSGHLEKTRQALEEAHRAEEDARSAFERSTRARVRILGAQAAGRLPDPDDLRALETYYRRTETAVRKGLQFVELSRQGDPLPRETSVEPRKVKKEGIEVMKIALRVLTALTEKTGPTADDIEGLLGFAPDLTRLPPDELACEVIQRAMKRQVHMQRALNTGSY
jgi:hypothetical protein